MVELVNITESRTVNIEQKRELIRNLIEVATADDTLIVHFVKVDGQKRRMIISPYKMREKMEGHETPEEYQESVLKRKINNPHLQPVFDVDVGDIRSINLDTVTEVFFADKIYEFMPYR